MMDLSENVFFSLFVCLNDNSYEHIYKKAHFNFHFLYFLPSICDVKNHAAYSFSVFLYAPT